jgi:Inositol monophosphatase family
MVIDRSRKYRPRIARIEFRCFAGLFLPLGGRGRCGRYLVSLIGIPLLLISCLGHYHEPWTELALFWKDENVTSELDVALSAAKEAGEVLRKGFGWQHSVRYKGEVDLVTEIDERAEQVIREILLGAFPTHGMLAEEGGALVGEENARWIVDPVDGTTNYAHGLSSSAFR